MTSFRESKMRIQLAIIHVGLNALLAVMIGASAGDSWLIAGGPQKSALAVGEKVPDFSITTLDGKSVKLSDLRKDKSKSEKGVVVLTFWCTSCHSCRHVDKHLAELAKSYI